MCETFLIDETPPFQPLKVRGYKNPNSYPILLANSECIKHLSFLHLVMLRSDMSSEIILPSNAAFWAAEFIAASSMIAVETAAIVLGLMADEVLL